MSIRQCEHGESGRAATARTGAGGSARGGGSAGSRTVQARLLSLQSIVGNRAVAGLVHQRRGAAGSGPVAVVQRCRRDPLCPNKDPCPIHDSYDQKSSPSVRPFLKSGQAFMGETAMRNQLAGTRPRPGDVRVPAVRQPHTRAGAGLDEGIPTSEAGKIAAGGNAALAGAQSGERGSTDLTILKSPTTPAGGHTGMFPKPVGPGSTNTTGQSAAHDVRRSLPASTDPTDVVLATAASYVASLANGPEVLQSPNLTGAVPNFTGAATIGAPATAGGPPDPARLQQAQQQHDRREWVKDRVASFAESRKRPRPVSPERERVDAAGGGGGYRPAKVPRRPATPPPRFGGTADFELAANSASWLTEPMRHGATSEFHFTSCPNCASPAAWGQRFCRACGSLLP